MPGRRARAWEGWGLGALCLALPFAVLFWLVPFASPRTLGADYPVFGIQAQMELLFSLRHGAWPLFVPGLGGGQSASALSLGQLHHPIAHLAALAPGYWDGYALQWNTFWRLLGLGAAHWAWLALLRRVRLRTDVAFLVAFAATYSLRMLDCFRYGGSLETWTGLLLLTAAIGAHGLRPGSWRTGLAVVGGTWWVLVSGHTPMSYFAALGAVAFALLWPSALAAGGPGAGSGPSSRVRFWGELALAGLTGTLLASAFLVPYAVDFVASNVGRVDRAYDWSIQYHDTVAGVLASFALPLRASVHSAFGGVPLIVSLAVAPLLRGLGVRVPGVVWAAWALGLAVLLFALGPATPVHRLFWKLLPLADAMRVPGRVTLLWPVPALVALVAVARLPSVPLRVGGRERAIPPLAALCALTFALQLGLAGLLVLGDPPLSELRPLRLRDVPAWGEPVLFAAGLLGLLALGARLVFAATRAWSGAAALGLAGLQVAGLLYWGNWVGPRTPTPTWTELREERRVSWGYPYTEGALLYHRAVARQLEEAGLEPRLARLAARAATVDSVDAAYARLRRDRMPEEVVIVGDPPDLPEAPDARGEPADSRPSLRLVESGFNKLVFETDSPEPAWLVANPPFTGHWHALGPEGPRPVRPADGLALGVPVRAGSDRVELRYWSDAAFAGVLLSALAVAGLGIALAFAPLAGLRRLALAVGAVVLALAATLAWRSSLYAGDLGHVYEWRAPARGRAPNLAFGKRVEASALSPAATLHRHHPSRAVDGQRAGDPALTRLGLEPHLTLDLGRTRTLSRLVLVEPPGLDQVNTRPLAILVSDDGERFRRVAEITAPAGDRPLRPLRRALPAGTAARYVRVQAAGEAVLAIHELELYGPTE